MNEVQNTLLYVGRYRRKTDTCFKAWKKGNIISLLK